MLGNWKAQLAPTMTSPLLASYTYKLAYNTLQAQQARHAPAVKITIRVFALVNLLSRLI